MSAYPQLTETQILKRDWGWINARLEAIDRDNRHKRLWELDKLLILAHSINGNIEPYQDIRGLYTTVEEDKLIQAERKRQLETDGKILQPKIVPI
jgi:hypothetical protein